MNVASEVVIKEFKEEEDTLGDVWDFLKERLMLAIEKSDGVFARSWTVFSIGLPLHGDVPWKMSKVEECITATLNKSKIRSTKTTKYYYPGQIGGDIFVVELFGVRSCIQLLSLLCGIGISAAA